MSHTPRKRFGQHFLTDTAMLYAITQAINPQANDCMVEIGPGLGAMTQPLLQSLNHLHVVELDRDLAARLRRQSELTAAATGTANLTVHEADVLQFDFAPLVGLAVASDTLPSQKLRIVGNLPYNISSPILFHLLQYADCVQDQVFMLQKEVVDRMAAQAGQADFGRLSVMLQARYAMQHVFDVPPECFDPPPRVMSAIVRMTPLPVAIVDATLWPTFERVVATAFGQRRKMLRGVLKPYLAGLEAVGILPTARAEEVSMQQFAALARWVRTSTGLVRTE